MSKIWMVQFRGYNGRKYYKTEASFMEAISQHHDRAIVTIFEEVEQHNALEYKNNLITQRDRENQLKVLLEDDSETGVLMSIKQQLEDSKINSREIRYIIKKLNSKGLTKKSFKEIINDQDVRKFILYKGPNTKQWYKDILTIHNFQIQNEYTDGYDWRNKKYNLKKIEQPRLDNIEAAKKEIKREKNEKKNISV
jgi:hypothetical protein